MLIAAHLGVLDEIELIERSIQHLRRIGVDYIIACDMGSTDGTLEVLEEYRGGTFEVVRMTNAASWDDWHQTAIAQLRDTPCDRVMFLDADEFWLPATGKLNECASLAHEVVIVDRFNVVLADSGPVMPASVEPGSYSEVLLHRGVRSNLRLHLETQPETPWISGVPMPKAIGHVRSLDSISMGGHDIGTTGRVSRCNAYDLIIAHVPFSTLDRFTARMRNLRRFFGSHEAYFEGEQGWHWRRWVKLADQGRIAEEFRHQVSWPPIIAEHRARGTIASAAEVLGELGRSNRLADISS